MKKLFVILLLLIPGSFLQSHSTVNDNADWGFYAHHLLNRFAVFTLPPEMMVFFKKNIEYITEHAVDPDKRRYSVRFEAVRHYIDIDHWGKYPFPNLPRNWTDALMRYTDVYIVNTQNDTLQILGNDLVTITDKHFVLKEKAAKKAFGRRNVAFFKNDYKHFFIKNIQSKYYEEFWDIDPDLMRSFLKKYDISVDLKAAFAVDRFSGYGIVPYHLPVQLKKLTKAFRDQDATKILRIAAETGHYIADACVPLHTTENYNGQLTGQIGIHAFWESRIPELFAREEYDSFVGKAVHLDHPKEYFWNIVFQSHANLHKVLEEEKKLRKEFPEDEQYCFDERLGRTVFIQCRAYSAAYQEHLDGMIEARWRTAIHSIGNVWYTAWVDAGRPDLSELNPDKEYLKKESDALDKEYRKGKELGRKFNG